MGLLSTIGAASGRAFGLTRVGAAIRDAYFNLTTLLLPGNGTNGAQNNTFLDSSSNNFTITRNGNTTQGTFSPFSQTGWSIYFDGTGDYLTTPDNAAFDLSTNDFTFECWVYKPNDNDVSFLCSGANGLDFAYLSGTLRVGQYPIAWHTTVTYSIPQNAWTHIAIVKASGRVYFFANGTLLNTGGTANTNSYDTTTTLNVCVAGDGTRPLTGYMTGMRLIKGQALATASFTPPTAPVTTSSVGWTGAASSLTGTVSLLVGQSNRFIDTSSNAFTLTVNGNPSVQAFSPFAPTAAYSAATVGGSGYFDGTGDYLASATSADLQLGSSDFSLEWWEYRTVLSNVDTAIVCGDGTFNAQLAYYNTGFPRFYLSTTGSSWNVFSDAATGAIAANSWNHFVLTRSGTAFRVFLNGVLSIYATGSGSVTQSTNQIFISGGVNGNSAPIEGYMSGVRFVKGSIPTTYQTSSTTTNTSIFTPPTAPVTTTSQGATSGDVKYLVNFTNAGITDATAKNVLETVGNAQISTTQSKFGGSSMYFDGSGDWLTFPSNPLHALGRGDFTIEFWFNPSSLPTYASIIDLRNPDTQDAGFNVLFYSQKISFGTSSVLYIAGTTNLSTGTWYHYALTRSGNTFKQFLNGTQEGTTYSGSSSQNFTNTILRIADGASGPYTGYLDDLRITRGYARYTSNFTAPTAAFPLQ